jgi:signal transduction histidine kinase/ligand-binding sensor domain-containing protein
MNLLQLKYFLLFCLLMAFPVLGQQYHLTKTFTQENGLPSNHVYDFCEDLDGFLWISTANGISRFDGKKFFNYTTRQGLPSNDVLQIGIDKTGTLWVSCYKQPPSYFDKRLNRFFIISDEAVANISNQLLYLSFNEFGQAVFRGHENLVIFDFKKNARVESIQQFFRFRQNNKSHRYRSTYIKTPIKYNLIEILNYKNEPICSIKIPFENRSVYWGDLTNHLDVFIDQYRFYRLKYDEENQKLSILDSIILPEIKKTFNVKNGLINFISANGNIDVYDLNSMDYVHSMSFKRETNTAYRDRLGNYWVGTLDNGVLLYIKSNVTHLELPPHFSRNLLSVMVYGKQFLIGNHNGQIFSGEFQDGFFQEKYIRSFPKPYWIRNVMSVGGKEIAISDVIISSQVYEVKPTQPGESAPISLKTAIKLSDRNIVFGTTTGVLLFDVETQEYKYLNAPKERILSLTRIDDSSFYYVANEGIHYHDLHINDSKLVFPNSEIANERIDKVVFTKDKKIAFSTYFGTIYFLNESYRILESYGEDIGLPENIKALESAEGHVLWVGTNKGVYGIDYKRFNEPKVIRVSMNDGLISNEVNAIDYCNNSLYVATNKGLSIIPMSGAAKRWPIYPKVVSVRIDGIDVPVQMKYKLEPSQTLVNIQFSGVELYGHFSKFQYSIENGIWNDMDGTMLNLQLRQGENKLKVRPVDDCNRVSENILALEFNVKIPFYNKLWFWVVMTQIVFFILFFLRYRYKLEQQRLDFEKQDMLRLQREKITADLHDEIGSTLSSLQINSAVSKRLIKTDIEKSKTLLNTIEKQARDLSEKIGDIIWSLKPEDQFMSLSTRIRNFASELISPTEIKYTINIDNNIDTVLYELTMRKNVLMICKEALNNAVKYSEAKHIEIKIELKSDELHILIADDGLGFDSEVKKGNGLTNMKRRTEELKGKLYITTRRAATIGTSIHIIIPLSLK